MIARLLDWLRRLWPVALPSAMSERWMTDHFYREGQS